MVMVPSELVVSTIPVPARRPAMVRVPPVLEFTRLTTVPVPVALTTVLTTSLFTTFESNPPAICKD